MSYRLRPAVRGPATRRRPERTGAPSSRQRRLASSASPQPRDRAASRPQGTRGGAPRRHHRGRVPRIDPGPGLPAGTAPPPRPPFPSRGPWLALPGEHHPAGGRCLPGPAAIPRVSRAPPLAPLCCFSAALGMLWSPPRRRSTWTWTSSRCTADPKAATSATRWTSTYLPLARKSPQVRVPAPLPGDPGLSPRPAGRRSQRPSRCPLGVPSVPQPPASTLPFYGCLCETLDRTCRLLDPGVWEAPGTKTGASYKGNTGPNRLKPVKTRTGIYITYIACNKSLGSSAVCCKRLGSVLC